jgi:hypothetical protein
MSECGACKHPPHEPGKCRVLYMWPRPGGPPGNGHCMCGVDLSRGGPGFLPVIAGDEKD